MTGIGAVDLRPKSHLREKTRFDVARMVKHRADDDVARFLGVKDVMRLKAKTPMPRREFLDESPDERKIRKQTKSSLKPRMIRVGLIGAERLGGIIVYLIDLSDRPSREPIATHGGR